MLSPSGTARWLPAPDRDTVLARMQGGLTEIRLHGRGGQGAVVASKILAKAFHLDGIWPQTFPKYGVERRGAPAAAFVRITDQAALIPIRAEITRPHHLIVLDATLVRQTAVTEGLREGGVVVINSTASPGSFSDLGDFRFATVDASGIALSHGLGSPMAPVVNSAILGAFVRALGKPTLEALFHAIEATVPTRTRENVAAAAEAHRATRLCPDH